MVLTMSIAGLRYFSLIAVAAVVFVSAPPLRADILVTDAEARLPPPARAAGTASRAITRGPRIEFAGVTDPARSPVRLQFRFEAFGGATVNLASLRLMYLKTPLIDLTDRIKPYVRATGLDMPRAELPAGEHAMRLELADSDGRTAVSNFVIRVAP